MTVIKNLAFCVAMVLLVIIALPYLAIYEIVDTFRNKSEEELKQDWKLGRKL